MNRRNRVPSDGEDDSMIDLESTEVMDLDSIKVTK